MDEVRAMMTLCRDKKKRINKRIDDADEARVMMGLRRKRWIEDNADDEMDEARVVMGFC